MAKVWQETMLAFFLGKELIDQARVDMLRSWKHSGFSVESETRLLTKADREALGQYVVRLATEGWQAAHVGKGDQNEVDADPADVALDVPDAWCRLRKQSWARLSQKIIAWAKTSAVVVVWELEPVGPGQPLPT